MTVAGLAYLLLAYLLLAYLLLAYLLVVPSHLLRTPGPGSRRCWLVSIPSSVPLSSTTGRRF